MWVALFLHSDKKTSGDDAMRQILPHLSRKFSKGIALIQKLMKDAPTTVSTTNILISLNEIFKYLPSAFSRDDYVAINSRTIVTNRHF